MLRSLQLPDGRSFTVADDLVSRLTVGLLVADTIRITSRSELKTETETHCDRLRELYSGRQPADIAGLQEARRLYRSTGVDPTRTRPSSEALLRRVLQGKSLHVINHAVDACNLASLSFLLPIGLYDLDRVTGDVSVRLGEAGEEYAGIRKGPVHLTGRLGMFDASGPFGSPTSDSARTCISDGTHRLLAVILATETYNHRQMQRHLSLLGDLLARHCAGTLNFAAVLPEKGPGHVRT
ncbi:MAG: phenylalanine--tRNA ligase beta subunit-related protein [bacterium]